MTLLNRILGRSDKSKTTIFVDGVKTASTRVKEPEPPKVDWNAFVEETMRTEQSQSKTPAPPPVPRKPLMTRFGNFVTGLVTQIVFYGVFLPVLVIAVTIVLILLLQPTMNR